MKIGFRYGVVLLLLLVVNLSGQVIFYVDSSRIDDTGDGTSWATAKKYIQSVLVLETDVDQIWVAKGTYYPDDGDGQVDNERSSVFGLDSDVKVFGGYPSGGGDRDWVSNLTILSGDIDQNDAEGNTDGNAFTVVTSTGASEETILDGFTITAGNANGNHLQRDGGGIRNINGSPQILNCIITGNSATINGGGMYNKAESGGTASPTLTNCIIRENISNREGAGLYNKADGADAIASPTLNDCTISNNQSDTHGGGIYNNVINGATASPTFNDCIISNNTVSSQGGGIYNYANGEDGTASPTFDDCIISNNTASSQGGGMYNYGSNGGTASPTFNDCTISNNAGSSQGGGMYNYGSNGGTASPMLTNCNITGNSSANGGGMYNYGSTGGTASPTFNDCTISNNTVSSQGGGIYNYANGEDGTASPMLTNCDISGNSGTHSGGGMYNIAQNEATIHSSLINCTITGNSSTHHGGGMYNNASNEAIVNPSLINCTITGNSSTNGGGMYNTTSSYGLISPTLTNCILWGNSSIVYNNDESYPTYSYSIIEGSGGSDSWDDDLGTDDGHNIDSGPWFVRRSDPVDAPTSAGDFRLITGSPAIDAGNNDVAMLPDNDLADEARIQNEVVDMGAFEGSEPLQYHKVDANAFGSGDGETWENAFTKLQNGLKISGGGHEIWVAEGVYYPDERGEENTDDRSSTFKIPSDVKMYGGFSGGEYDKAYRDLENNLTVLSGDIDQNNEGENIDGNAFNVVTFTDVTEETVFDGFTITAGNANGNSKQRDGGGIRNINGSPQILNCIITRNNAMQKGGGIFNNAKGADVTASPTLTNCTIIDNNASQGAGMYNDSSSRSIVNPILTSCIITDNTASSQGGGMYNNAMFATLSPIFIDCEIRDNIATNNGGGMYSNIQVSSTFSPEFTNCDITGNSSVTGGGMYNTLVSQSIGNATFTNCTISDNTASSQGGGIYNNINTATFSPEFSNCDITGNSGTNGGGIYNNIYNGTDNRRFTNCTISGNSASYQGGGIYNNVTMVGELNSTLTNCVISGNSSINGGGGMYNNASNYSTVNPNLINCTITGNSGTNGGGMHNTASNDGFVSPTLTNCILWGNSSIVYNNDESYPTYSYSIIEGSGGSDSWDDDLGSDDGHNIDSGPWFVRRSDPVDAPTSAGDFRLITGSPAIDAGNNAIGMYLSERDLSDEDRIQNYTVDMGAFEGSELLQYHKVDASAFGSGDGETWENAFTKLQNGLRISGGGHEIWVAEGVYYPDERGEENTDDRLSTFKIPSDVKMYGGFDGGEIDKAYRDLENNLTVLSGDIDGDDQNDDGNGIAETYSEIQGTNAFNVVTFTDVTEETVFDGFTITAGNADGNHLQRDGGGIRNINGSPQILNCIITGNSATNNGGGMYTKTERRLTASPTLINCIVTGNNANSQGGGIHNYTDSTPNFINCYIKGNLANNGGGMYNYSSSPTLTNCIISGNLAIHHGGGMQNNSASTVLTNCTISGNRADSHGGGVYNQSSTTIITNSILWGNTGVHHPQINIDATITYSDVSDGWEGEGNINSDPLFSRSVISQNAPTTEGDLRLYLDSPALDAGNNNAEHLHDEDIEGESRNYNGTVDMGAYEWREDPPVHEPVIYRVDVDVISRGNGMSWVSAFNTLKDALDMSESGDQIWVAAGTYYPDEGQSAKDNRRYSTFAIPSGVKLYGGFAGDEDNLDNRVLEENETILSGDIDDSPDDNSSNAYIVVTFNDVSEETVLNGFTITGGYRQAQPMKGAGIYNKGGDPAIINCKIIDNHINNGPGGGIYNEDGSPILTNCIISGNTAGTNGNAKGGGLYNIATSDAVANLRISNSTISGNASYHGGGLYNNASTDATATVNLVNCIVSGNHASSQGGGIHNYSQNHHSSTANATFINCTISNNTGSSQGGGTYASRTNALFSFTNSIIEDNEPTEYINGIAYTYSYSNIEGSGGSDSWDPSFGTDNGHNIDLYSRFVDSAEHSSPPTMEGDYHLSQRSPAIDAGNNEAENLPESDLDGNTRIQDGTGDDVAVVDIGAYETEYQPDIDPAVVESICPDMDRCPNNPSEYSEVSNLILTLNEEVYPGEGTITIMRGDEMAEQIIMPMEDLDTRVTIDEEVITINPDYDFILNTEYSVEMTEGIFMDEGGNRFAGFNDEDNHWHFVIDREPPTGTFNPANESTGNAVDTDITLSFEEVVFLSADGSDLTNDNVDALITLKEDDESGSNIAFDATVANGEETVITVNPNDNFPSEQRVYVSIGATLKDEAGNFIEEDEATFTTADVEEPTLTFDPVNDATGFDPDADITITFSEPVMAADGTEITNLNIEELNLITLNNNDADGAAIASSVTINPAKTVITVNPTTNLGSEQVVYVALISDLEDYNSNSITGTLNSTFTTATVDAATVSVESGEGIMFPTSMSSIPIRITFNKNVSGFEQADISVVNGSAGDFSTLTPSRVFAANIAPSSREVTVAIPGEVAIDNYNVSNAASSPLKVIYDPYAPTVQFNPRHSAKSIALDFSDITLTFNKRVKIKTDDDPEEVSDDNLMDVITFKKALTAENADFNAEGGTEVDYSATFEIVEVVTDEYGHKITLNPEGEALDGKSEYYLAVNADKIIDFNDADLDVSASSATFSTINNLPPEIISFKYDDGAGWSQKHSGGALLTGVPTASDLIMMFDEAVVWNDGQLNLYKNNAEAEDQLIEAISVPDEMNRITGNNSLEHTFNLESELEGFVDYYVLVEPNSFKDENDNMYAGIDNADTWKFRTRDSTPPIFVGHSPDPGVGEIFSIEGEDPIELVFSEPVVAGEGIIEIYDSEENTVVERIDISTDELINDVVIPDNSDRVQITPENLASGSRYHILIKKGEHADGALLDVVGNPLDDIVDREDTDISIHTSDIMPPAILSYAITAQGEEESTSFEANWDNEEGISQISENVDMNSEIQINFDEGLFITEGVLPMDNDIDQVVDLRIDPYGQNLIVDFDATISDDKQVITLKPNEPLTSESTYFVHVKPDILEDASRNVLGEGRRASFVTADTDPPQLLSTVPEAEAGDVNIETNVVLTFDEAVESHGRLLIIVPASDDRVVIDLTNTDVVSVEENVVTIELEEELESTTVYSIVIEEDAVHDLSENFFDGDEFTFTTGDFEPPEVTFTPEHMSGSIAVDTDLIIAFSEPITIDEEGGITDENVASLVSFESFPLEEEEGERQEVPFDAVINAAADTITLTLPDDEEGNPVVLLGNTNYYMAVDYRIMDGDDNIIRPSPQSSTFVTASPDAPTVTVSTEVESPTNISPIAFAIEFSESVSEFDSTDVTFSGGERESFSGENNNFSISIAPGGRLLSVRILGDVATSSLGNGNAASNTLEIIYDDVAPTVGFSPDDNRLDVSLNSKVYITFSEPVFTVSGDSLALDDLTGSVSVRKDSIDGEVQSFDMAYNDTTGVIKLTPPDSLVSAAHYYVAITTELYDEAGNPFAGDSSYFKAEDIEPPTITLVPTDGTTDVAVNAYMRVNFSERIYSETGEKFEDFEVSEGMVVVREDNASGRQVDFTSQISPDTTAITLQASDLLKGEQTYYVKVNPRFADVNGTVVEKTTATFTTVDIVPAEITLSPAEGTEDVALETELVISFSEPVRLTDDTIITAENVKGLLYVNIWNPEGEAIDFTVSVNAARDEITLTLSEALPSYEKIVFGFNDGLEDYSDNLASTAAGYFFTTGIPGFDIDPLSGITTTETGLSDTFEVALTSEPDAPVDISIMSSDITEGTPYPTQLTFNRYNWDQAQWVKVTGVDDPDGDGDITYHVRLFNITSDDPDYSDFEVDSVEVININDDPPGIQIYPISRLITSEEAKQAQFKVVLLSRPTATVTIPVSTSDVTEASVDVTQLVFEPENWDQKQTVTLTGLDDDEDDDNVEYNIVLGEAVSTDADYSVIDPTDILAVNIDNDMAGFTIGYDRPLSTNEMGTDTVFTVAMNTEPKGSVSVSVSSGDDTEGVTSHDYITFSPSNWDVPQEVTVTGVNDNLGDGDVYYNIMVGEAITSSSPDYGRLDALELKAVNLDREPGIEVVSELMSFDSSDVGVLDSAFVTVVNSGPDTLVLSQATVNDSAFSAIFAPSPIKSGDSSQVTVYFLPDKQGERESVLYVEHNDPYQFPKELLISASVLDKSGPAIIELSNNPSTVSTGSDVQVTVQVSDFTGVSGLALNYTSGVSGFSSLDMEGDSETSFSGTIPAGTADLTGLAYFIVATDTKGNITYSDTVSVPVTFGDKLLSTDVPGSAYPSGISKDAWRLISVPNMIDENKATQIFGNELKDRNERSWRLVSDFVSKEKWQDVKEITPGMGMWLYQQVKDNVSISTGAGTTSDLKRYELTVRSGWSIIGSPYAFTFTADIDGEVFSGPYGYALDGVEGWSDVVTQFQPWAGYIIKNLTSQDQVLTLRPFASAGSDSFLKRELAGEDIGWDVNLSAVSGKYGDLYNRLGRAPGAWEGIGPFDHQEPPIMLGGISLAFRQEDGRSKKLMYARDMRSVSEHNGIWPMDLIIKGIKEPISLTVELDEHYPLDLGLVILDHQTREVTDLKEDPDLKINHGNEDVPYRFTVVSGDGDYIIRKVEEILAGIPERFSLGQNYPNPFNSTTTIRYALPLPEFVNITIYNILGQEVHKMVGSWQEAGFHTARWDGRDLQGIPVSSGVYIYHIQAGKFMAARKMAIIK